MNEIRVAWNIIGRRSIANESIQGGLWHPDTPENRETLAIVMASSNEYYGHDFHWIEERQV
ncbi:MAG TPA: hypothetical protein VGK09_06840 [Rhodocyclaceae bacterium]|jgi:hypothetical protein